MAEDTQNTKLESVRQNTKLESEGAEFLVLGNLLIEGVFCYKAYVNFPGYDLVATNPATSRVARIQVKSRWATDYDKSFPIKNYNCDFVVHVALNRGYRFRKKPTPRDTGVKDPEFYVFPVEAIRKARNPNSKWGKTNITNVKNWQSYRSNWKLISAFLSVTRQT
jgi:PD-(D/E)XK endonuclease